MTRETAYRLLDLAVAYRPVVIPAAEPDTWYVQSEGAPGTFHTVGARCTCTAGAFGKPCSHRAVVGAIIRGVLDYGTWRVTRPNA